MTEHALPAPPILRVEAISTGFGRVQVLRDVSIAVQRGERVVLLGHNGSGKSTLLRCVFGLQSLWSGAVHHDGADLRGTSVADRIRAGIGYVPQVRPVFRDLSVRENLQLSRISMARETAADVVAAATDLFPVLSRLLKAAAGTLSGGEERMLGLAMALVRRPSLLLVDEPSAGLSPAATEELLESLDRVCSERRVTVVMAEQRVARALEWAERAVILKAGALAQDGPATTLRALRGAELASHL